MKFFLSAILLLSIVSLLTGSTPSYSNSVFTPEEIKHLSSIPVKIYFNGEHYYSDKFRFNLTDEKRRMEIYKSEENDNADFLSMIPLTLDRNYYDLQTNNSPQLIWQNPNNIKIQGSLFYRYMFWLHISLKVLVYLSNYCLL